MKMEEDRLTIAVIIPNEEVLNIEDFYDECRTNKRHHEDMIEDFIKKYNIDAYDEYDLVASGHIFLRIIDNLVIAYMPSHITELQYEKLLEKRELLEQFPCFSANFFNNKDLIIENTFGDYDTKGINILDCFYNEVKEYYGLSTSRK